MIFAFSIIDISPINFYLGLKIEKDWKKIIIKLSQLTYISNIFQKYYFNKANIINIIMKKTELLISKIDSRILVFQKKTYQRIIEILIFSIIEIRLDIIFMILIISRFP